MHWMQVLNDSNAANFNYNSMLQEWYPQEINGGHFHLKLLFPLSLFFPLCKAEECHIWYSQQASSPIPQSSLVPDDEQAARGHPATQSLSKHPPVLCGSDLITVPGPCCALPSLSPLPAQRPQIVILPLLPSRITPPPVPFSSLAYLSRLKESSDRLNSFTSWGFMSFIYLFFPLLLLLPLFFFSNRRFCRQLSQLISIGCPTGNRQA